MFLAHRNGWSHFSRLLQLLPVPEPSEGPCGYPLWPQFLYGLHQWLLERGRLHRDLHLSPMQDHVHPEACASAQRHPEHGGWEDQEERADPQPQHLPGEHLRRAERRPLWLLLWEETEGCEVLSQLSGVLLREALEAPLRICHIQKAQAGGAASKPGQEDLSAAPEVPGALLSNRSDVYLRYLHSQWAQGPWHCLCWGGEGWETGRRSFCVFWWVESVISCQRNKQPNWNVICLKTDKLLKKRGTTLIH